MAASPMDDERFDGMYIQMAQTVGGIDPLLDSFFGFLRRKTDFLSGAQSATAAQDTVVKSFLKNKERYDEDVKEKAAKEKKRKAEEEKRKCGAALRRRRHRHAARPPPRPGPAQAAHR